MVSGHLVELDTILKQLGAFGKYNIINYALLLFPIYLAGMYGSVFVFEAPDIQYRCNTFSDCEHVGNTSWLEHAIPKNKENFEKCQRYALNDDIQTSIDNGTCDVTIFNKSSILTCDGIVYSDEYSVVKDFDLGCQDWKGTLIGTIHNCGLFIALPLTGFISDKYGRKLALSIASLMNGIFGCLRSFATSYVMLVTFEFLEAAMGAGAYSTAFVIAMELVGPKGRVFGNTLINAVYVLGLITLSGMAWWLQSWRNLLRVIYLPAILVLSYLWILNESVRWLLSKGRHNEAAVILKRAAKMNNIELSDEILAPLYRLETISCQDPDDEKEKENTVDVTLKEEKSESDFLKVLKSRIIRKRVLVCSFLWMTCTLVYYGLSINSVSLPGNKYVNFMLVAFVEIPANFACLLVLDKFGRRRTLITTYILSACLCISLAFLPKDPKWLSLIFYLSGKFSITVAYSSVYIYVSEVFPTNVRQSLLAVCSALGRVGSSLAPLTPLLRKIHVHMPTIFFGGFALVASGMVLTLPETINVALPDTVEEAERLSQTKNKKQAAA